LTIDEVLQSSYKIVTIDVSLVNITIDEVIIYEVITKCK